MTAHHLHILAPITISFKGIFISSMPDRYKLGHSPQRGWRENEWWLCHTLGVCLCNCSHPPVEPSGPRLLPPPRSGPPVITGSAVIPPARTPPLTHSLLRTGKWLLLLFKFLPISIRKKNKQPNLTASEDPQQTSKICAFFLFVFKMHPVHKINSIHVPTWITSFL